MDDSKLFSKDKKVKNILNTITGFSDGIVMDFVVDKCVKAIFKKTKKRKKKDVCVRC